MTGERFTTLALLALLAGCTSTGAGFAVNVPVPVYCTEPEPAAPAWPTDALSPGVSLDTWVKSAQAEILMRDAHEAQLRTALHNCKEKAPG